MKKKIQKKIKKISFFTTDQASGDCKLEKTKYESLTNSRLNTAICRHRELKLRACRQQKILSGPGAVHAVRAVRAVRAVHAVRAVRAVPAVLLSGSITAHWTETV